MKSKLLKMVLVLLVVAMPMDVKASSTGSGGVIAILTSAVVAVGLAALVLSRWSNKSGHFSDLEELRKRDFRKGKGVTKAEA